MADDRSNIDFSIDCSHVYIWQYDQTEVLNKILEGTEKFIKSGVADFWKNYAEKIFTISTADTFGLELWGKTLGIKRPYYTDPATQTLKPVSDELYRRMLIGAIYKFNMAGTVPEINRYLGYVFPGKQIYVIDNLDMTMRVIAYWEVTAEEYAVLSSDQFIPRPAGVQVNFEIYDPDGVFGFTGSELEGFNVGVFAR